MMVVIFIEAQKNNLSYVGKTISFARKDGEYINGLIEQGFFVGASDVVRESLRAMRRERAEDPSRHGQIA